MLSSVCDGVEVCVGGGRVVVDGAVGVVLVVVVVDAGWHEEGVVSSYLDVIGMSAAVRVVGMDVGLRVMSSSSSDVT